MGTETKIVIPENLRLPLDRGSLSEISRALESLQSRLGLTDGSAIALRLVLEELVTNSIMHGAADSGHDGPEAGVHIDFLVEDGFLHFRYTDHGAPFDPRKDLPRDAREDHLDDRPDGQLGWLLILHYCDLLHYGRNENRNCMLLRLREEIPPTG